MKKFFIILMAILILASAGIIGWYAYILAFAPEKIVSQTYEVGAQKVTLADGSTETKSFMDVNVFNNAFEVKFNYMLDENQTAFYSQGLQFVAKNNTFNFDGEYQSVLAAAKFGNGWTDSNFLIGRENYSDIYRVLGNKKFENIDVFNYMSGDDFETTMLSTNPIDAETMFKIQIGDNLYGMKLKNYNHIIKVSKTLLDTTGENKVVDEIPSGYKIGNSIAYIDYNFSVFFGFDYFYNIYHDYKACDIYYLCELLYNSVSEGMKAGTNYTTVFEFGDLFNYYLYDEEKQQYSQNNLTSSVASKISADVKSYYSIKVNVFDDELDSSSESLFNCFKGNSNYNVGTDYSDYFLGRQVKSLTNLDFEYVVADDKVKFKLSEKFLKVYENFGDKLYLDICIDLDTLDFEFDGFVDGTLDNFGIYRIYTISNGIESEVAV